MPHKTKELRKEYREKNREKILEDKTAVDGVIKPSVCIGV